MLEIWSTTPDGSDTRRELIDTVSFLHDPFAFCWSPDCKSISWIRNFAEGYGEVMVRDLATGRERQLTSDRKIVDEVIWSTNDHILFVSNRSGQSNLWMIPAGGGEAIQLTQGAVPIFAPRISDDNKTLIYLQQEYIGDIWISSIDGSHARRATHGDITVVGAVFSPDRREIAYISKDFDVYNVESHLWVMDSDGSIQRQLTSGSEVVTDCDWSPDGKWLSYSSHKIGEPPDSGKVYLIQPLNQGTPRMLCYGHRGWWFDQENLQVAHKMKTIRYPINGGASIQVFEDSTEAYPDSHNSQFPYFDARQGRTGWWVKLDGSQGTRDKGSRRILPADQIIYACPHDYRFFIFRRGDELIRVWSSNGREERIGTALPGYALMSNVSMDGKELLWIALSYPSQFVLVKNAFE